MIKTFFIAAFLGFAMYPFQQTHSQFLNLQLKVEPELSTTVEQNLDFGTQVINSGRNEIRLGDVNMGVFSIRAYHTQNVYLNLEYPDSLVSNFNQSFESIPLYLSMSYNNSGNNNASNSIPLTQNSGLVSIHENTGSENSRDLWKQLYLYVYGYIDVNNVPNGVYSADIVLRVDYD
jgi:hypothetical protein